MQGDYVLSLAGYSPEGTQSGIAPQLEIVIEKLRAQSVGRQIELSDTIQRLMGDRTADMYLLDGIAKLSRPGYGLADLFGMRILGKVFYVANVEDGPYFLPQKAVEDPALFLSRWALSCYREAYATAGTSGLKLRGEQWLESISKIGYKSRGYFEDFSREQERTNLLAEVTSIVYDTTGAVQSFNLTHTARGFVRESGLQEYWLACMNHPVRPQRIDIDSEPWAHLHALGNDPSTLPPLVVAVIQQALIYIADLDEDVLATLIPHEDAGSTSSEPLIAYKSNWPLPADSDFLNVYLASKLSPHQNEIQGVQRAVERGKRLEAARAAKR